jgi:hypothetical protein
MRMLYSASLPNPPTPPPPTAQPTQRSAGRSQPRAEGSEHGAEGSEDGAEGSEDGAEVLVQREPRADEGRVVEGAQPEAARERERALLLDEGPRAAERVWLGLGLGLGLGFGLGFEFSGQR